MESMIASIIGGSVSALVVAPLDTARTRLQLQGSLKSTLPKHAQSSNVFNALLLIGKNEGWKGYFRGYSAAAIAIPAFWCTFMPLYEINKNMVITHYTNKYYSKEEIIQNPELLPNIKKLPWIHSLSAIMAAIVADAVTNPLWVVRTRLQAYSLHQLSHDGASITPRPRTVFLALKEIIRNEGYSALYKGLLVSWFGASHSAIQFPLYEYLKYHFVWPQRSTLSSSSKSSLSIPEPQFNDGGIDELDGSLVPSSTSVDNTTDLGTTIRLIIASSVAKTTASICTYPHEVVRSRLQDQRNHIKQQYNGLIDCAIKIYKLEGIKNGLYSGFSANLLRTLPATAAMLVCYEYIIQLLREKNIVEQVFFSSNEE